MTIDANIVIDCHTHFQKGAVLPTRKEEESIEYGASEIIKELDISGVGMAAVSASYPMKWVSWTLETLGGNEEVVEAIKGYPARIIGLFVPNVYASSDTIKEQIEKAVNEYKFRGVKIQGQSMAMPANCSKQYPVYETASKLHLPVLFHSGTAPYCTPLLIADVALTFPEVPVIMGHAGKGDLWYDIIPAAKLSENIYIDTSGQNNSALIEKFVKEIGAHRVLFGSDWPWIFMKSELQRVLDLDISEENRKLILGKNAQKLFHLL